MLTWNRCLNISFSHTLVSPPSHRNALALLIRAQEFSSLAIKSLAASAPSQEATPLRLDVSGSRLQNLQTFVQKTHLHTRALVELHNHSANSAIAARKNLTNAAPVVDSLNEYPGSGDVDLTRLVEWPPKLKPVPVKPLFFDTAWNYIDYPGQNPAMPAGVAKDKVGGGKEEAQQPASRGWFGFGKR
jgi:signal recognition particle subunit SRP68